MEFSRAATCRRIGNETSPKLTNPFHTVAATEHLPRLDRLRGRYVSEPDSRWRNRTPRRLRRQETYRGSGSIDGPGIAPKHSTNTHFQPAAPWSGRRRARISIDYAH